MIPNTMRIAISEIESKLNKDSPIKERLKQAMKEARNHWLVVDEEQQFRCAVGAVLLTASVEEKDIISQEMKFIRSLSAVQTGVPVNLDALLEESDPKKFYGLLGMWNELKK